MRGGFFSSFPSDLIESSRLTAKQSPERLSTAKGEKKVFLLLSSLLALLSTRATTLARTSALVSEEGGDEGPESRGKAEKAPRNDFVLFTPNASRRRLNPCDSISLFPLLVRFSLPSFLAHSHSDEPKLTSSRRENSYVMRAARPRSSAEPSLVTNPESSGSCEVSPHDSAYQLIAINIYSLGFALPSTLPRGKLVEADNNQHKQTANAWAKQQLSSAQRDR